MTHTQRMLVTSNWGIERSRLASFLPCQSKVSDAEQQRLAKASVFFLFFVFGDLFANHGGLVQKEQLRYTSKGIAKGVD